MTLLEVLNRATGYLEKQGSSSPRLDAELLLGHALGLRRIDLYLQFERTLNEEELAAGRELIGRRGKHEPVAYIIGRREFMGLDFEVTPAVLIPNPDTEVLVEQAVSWGRSQDGRRLRVADVGTGSGCVAVSIAHYLKTAQVWAGDDEVAALEVAARNVRAHHLEDRVTLCRGDLLEALPGKMDLICANLPYVTEGEVLAPEVTAQPAHALFASEGGAALLRRLLEESLTKLAPSGRVMAELAPGLEAGLDLSAYAGSRLHRDLAGLVRVIEAWI
jgi:release factor glutamine methyltransferase